MSNKRFPSIPEPAPTPEALYNTVNEMKQLVEILAQQRKPYSYSGVTWSDLVALGLIKASQVPT